VGRVPTVSRGRQKILSGVPAGSFRVRERATYRLVIRTNLPAGICALGLLAVLGCDAGRRAPVLDASPDSVVFGDLAVGRMSPARVVEWTNAGADSVVFSALDVSGPAAADFVLAEDLCAGVTLAPGESCSAAVLFGPREPGAREASIAAGGEAGRAAGVALLGEGTGDTAVALEEGGLVRAVPETLDFGEQPLGAPGGPLGLRLVNRRPGAVQFAARLRAGPASGFRIALDRCSNEILRPGRACSIQVLFVPEAEGLLSAELVLRDLNGPTVQTVPVWGTGIPETSVAGDPPPSEVLASVSLGVVPQAVEFGVQAMGSAGPTRRVQIRNDGASNVVIRSLRVAGNDAESFRIARTDCSQRALYPTRTCSLEVVFEPTGTGGQTGRVEALTNAGRVPALVLLAGTGGAP